MYNLLKKEAPTNLSRLMSLCCGVGQFSNKASMFICTTLSIRHLHFFRSENWDSCVSPLTLSIYVCLSVYSVSGLYSDPPEGRSTCRRSEITSTVIHQSGAIQCHPAGPGVSDNQHSIISKWIISEHHIICFCPALFSTSSSLTPTSCALLAQLKWLQYVWLFSVTQKTSIRFF